MKHRPLSAQNLLKAHPGLAHHRLLLALSGGVDSMTLAELLRKAGVNFSAAHCNFQLRATSSDEDEKFVRNYCINHQIPFFTKKFDVEAFKQSGNYSTQMAARELRYRWFRELMAERDFDWLLTAHHLDDSFETFLINLTRGSGLKGLLGIRQETNNVLRPLLSWSKEEILNYAQQHQIRWQEDESNVETDYARNKIRHLIHPVLSQIHPEYLKNFAKTIDFLQNDKSLITNHIEKIRNKIFKKDNEDILMDIAEIQSLEPSETYLYYLFSEFGFEYPAEVAKLIRSSNNVQISSKTHRLIKNRGQLILTAVKTEDKSTEIELNRGAIIQKPLYLKVLESDNKDEAATETFDAEKVKFPIRLRKPNQTDMFRPLGMKGSKKLSKFFKDEKYSMADKERAWVLADKDDRIIYVIGKRMDERFKITEHTQLFLNIYLCSKS